jgi:hypothetical protein
VRLALLNLTRGGGLTPNDRPRIALADQAQLLSNDRPIQLSPKSVAVPNMEKLDIFEFRQQVMRLS